RAPRYRVPRHFSPLNAGFRCHTSPNLVSLLYIVGQKVASNAHRRCGTFSVTRGKAKEIHRVSLGIEKRLRFLRHLRKNCSKAIKKEAADLIEIRVLE